MDNNASDNLLVFRIFLILHIFILLSDNYVSDQPFVAPTTSLIFIHYPASVDAFQPWARLFTIVCDTRFYSLN